MYSKADVIRLEDVKAVMVDVGYRRGYCQGYYAAIRDMRVHSSLEMRSFFREKLLSWRRKKPLEKMIFPPVLDSKDPQ